MSDDLRSYEGDHCNEHAVGAGGLRDSARLYLSDEELIDASMGVWDMERGRSSTPALS